MKRIFNYLPLHFVVLLIVGICFQKFTHFWVFSFLSSFLILLSLALLCIFIKPTILKAISLYLFFFVMGIFVLVINDDRNYSSHYDYHESENPTIIIQVHKVLKSNDFYQKYEAKVVKVNNNHTSGKVLLNVRNKTSLPAFFVDDRLMLKTDLKPIILPKNPHQFNYKLYLADKNIFKQLFLEEPQFLVLKNKKATIFGLSAQFRNLIERSLKKHGFKNNELAVIKALILGQRQDVSKELITDYQKAGAIHILAVSGLHIGVLLWILSFLLKPLEKYRYGAFFKTTILVLLLWLFAFLSGLSASVVRAVTMFTFLAIGLSFKSKKAIDFAFITSMFFILLVAPNFLFDVGFQLSYLAVFGILWLQPAIEKMYKPKNLISSKIWQLMTVSIAAQIAILPLSIFYFHQFPGLFLLSNLVIIPFLAAILSGGLLVIFLALFNILPQFLADFYSVFITYMNAFVKWVSLQEAFLFKGLFLSFFEMLTWYLFFFFGALFFMNKSIKKLLLFLSAILIVQVVFLINEKQFANKKQFLVFHKNRASIVGKREGKTLFLQQNILLKNAKIDNAVLAYITAEGINKIKQTDFKNALYFKNFPILIVDSLGVYKLSNTQKPIVVLQNSPKINITRLIKQLNPVQIIADGSNYKTDIIRWEKECIKKGIPFHATSISGAYVSTTYIE
ncbi:ComEC/Rec2 family competence protein [uncultured Polaribacter sp.]|uniref:ComEC/Rec2 family competence protein n=1 Tax=uncultured Polaribacter sp. TaxID=174711 RepID=UPI00262114A3|nr:ComEC/Rec2 family competence protein [uncultured Polaribacter sp.]